MTKLEHLINTTSGISRVDVLMNVITEIAEESEMQRWAVEIIKDNMEDHDNAEDAIHYLKDLATKGCVSGIVPEVISQEDTTELFRDYMTLILEYIDNVIDDIGYDPFDDCEYKYIPNNMVWFVIDDTASKLYSILMDDWLEEEAE
ncbi:hypothetical protein U7128_000228 [Bacillus phage KKP_4050]